MLEHARAGSMRRRIALLNRMIRGWRAYYRAGVPRQQFEELDTWLEAEVRFATRRRWAGERPAPRDLELAGFESLVSTGRRVFQPPPPPSLEGHEYRLPLEGEEPGKGAVLVEAGESLEYDGTGCVVVGLDRGRARLAPSLRAVVIGDGARCEAHALRWLLERGIALRFVAAGG